MLRPMATANTITSMFFVMPTVAVASGPRWATKKISTMSNRDSMAISSIIGTASRTMARSMEMAVKSCLEPRMASLTSANHWDAREAAGLVAAVLKGQFLNLVARTGSRKQTHIDRDIRDRQRMPPAVKGSAD